MCGYLRLVRSRVFLHEVRKNCLMGLVRRRNGEKRDKILPRMIGFNRPIMTYLRIFARIQGYLARRQGYLARG